ncbi:PREDICTED: uncharacterized protein LOC109156344 [Ipomoea nil]|uniref:uncharacterized protein LOC109156344 n=1 Tax=Ipomoea nil TaxID=35883 RepID=UPI000901DB7E|nr:PREDICTED: uncharacterized protein LOC109156344 [Ipomoea nil]
MDEEFEALHRNNTLSLVPRGGRVPIDCKWAYQVKRKSNGSVDRYKARLVAKGFLQIVGRDYFETYGPVMKPATIRLVLTIALSNRWGLRQLDINNAFLHGTLHEEVYMEQPPRYVDPLYPTHVCRLTKVLYGLKYAPEPVYVDDILLTSNNVTGLNRFVKILSAQFALKDLGTLHHFLGVKVISTVDGTDHVLMVLQCYQIDGSVGGLNRACHSNLQAKLQLYQGCYNVFLSQSQYITDILTQFKTDGAKDVSTPLAVLEKLVPLQSPDSAVDATQFRRLVGLMQYFVITGPDVAFVVNRLSQFMHAPSELHWQAAKRLLRYLKGTICHGLFLRAGQPLLLRVYTDSNWGGCDTVGRSTTTYLVYLGDNLISWKSSRQNSVSRSSIEAEYQAIANAAAEVL